MKRNGQGQIKTCRRKQHVKTDGMKGISNLFCGIFAVGGNYNLTRDNEWLLLKPTDSEQRDIFELLHRRRKKSSTIFCSQYEFEEWYDQLGGDDSPLADAIIDRIAHDSYRINITSIDAEHDISMREVYGLDKTLRE